MASFVEQQVQRRIAAARRKTEEQRRQRAELQEAREYGLRARHAAKRARSAEDSAPAGAARNGDPTLLEVS